jgi:S1-C subfamily serine protease
MRKRAAVYSSMKPAPAAPPPKPSAAPAKKPARKSFPKTWIAAAALLAVLGASLGWLALQPRGLSPQQVEAIVKRVLEKQDPAPSTTDAYEKVLPSIVAVRAIGDDGEEGTRGMETGKAEWQRGTGVVIVESGVILTNLHVVAGARRVFVTFMDGHESEADLIGQRAEHDLAVLKAKTLPDDIMPATMRSTGGLKPGEPVLAVGYPFGIGPSASAGVISGLKREYVSPEGKRMLSNLIQFDAAVNPGNSGGPLVTLDGEVVGIVTGLLNPTEQRVFIGIGFAVPIENAASAVGLSPF